VSTPPQVITVNDTTQLFSFELFYTRIAPTDAAGLLQLAQQRRRVGSSSNNDELRTTTARAAPTSSEDAPIVATEAASELSISSGRPAWADVFERLVLSRYGRTCAPNATAGVFFCGSVDLARAVERGVRDATHTFPCPRHVRRFAFTKENF
jgi:hypothetical protein